MSADWISVENEMPDADTTVMIACPGSDEPVWLGFHDGEAWRAAEGDRIEVTHWSPIPEPPQE